MNEQFVPYEIAKQLKQKGFNEYCLGLYQKNKKLIYAKPNNVWNNFWTDDELTGKIPKPGNLISTWKQEEIDEERKKGNTFESCVGYAAPLWQQVIDWLSNTHNIEVDALRYTYSGGVYKGKCYMWYVDQYDPKYNHELEEDNSYWILNERKSQGYDFKSKQEAIQAGIIEALTLI